MSKERFAQKRAAEISNTNENININEPEVNPVPNDEQEETSGFVMNKNNSRCIKLPPVTVSIAIKDLKKAGLIETKQRYREQGGKRSLLYKIISIEVLKI